MKFLNGFDLILKKSLDDAVDLLGVKAGLALANSLATALESVALIALMSGRLKGLEGGYIWKGVGLSLLGTGLMSAIVLGWLAVFGGGSRVVILAGSLGFGLAAYLGLMWLLKMPELRGMMRTLLRKVKGK